MKFIPILLITVVLVGIVPIHVFAQNQPAAPISASGDKDKTFDYAVRIIKAVYGFARDNLDEIWDWFNFLFEKFTGVTLTFVIDIVINSIKIAVLWTWDLLKDFWQWIIDTARF